MKKLSKTIVKKRAYRAFQIFLRTLWTKRGYCKCYTCGKKIVFKQTQVGHWITGHTNATYINEDFVRPQCVACNIMKGGNLGEFRDKIRKEIGKKNTDELLKYSKEKIEISVNDYLELERFYKEQLENLTNNK